MWLSGSCGCGWCFRFRYSISCKCWECKSDSKKKQRELKHEISFTWLVELVLKNYSAPLNFNCQLLGGSFSIGSDWRLIMSLSANTHTMGSRQMTTFNLETPPVIKLNSKSKKYFAKKSRNLVSQL